MKQKAYKQERKPWFRFLKQFLKIFIRKPEFVYLGDKPANGSIILTNHEGAKSPLTMEIYAEFPLRLWGTYEMNSGLKEVYKYLSYTYYHKKKHWNLFLSRIFCIIAAPLVNIFYKGLRLIPTYKDARFLSTIKKSIEEIEKGTNIVIFPENSDNGYFETLKQFYGGFVVLADRCFKLGRDVDIFVAYYVVKAKKYIIDKPIKYSKLKKLGNLNQIAEFLLNRCNTLGHTEISKLKEE